MKYLTFALAVCLSPYCLADDTKTSDDKSKTVQSDSKSSMDKTRMMSSNHMIGNSVYNNRNEALGDINSLVVSKKGDIHFVIMGRGGVAGVGETEVVVPWKAINCECKIVDGEMHCKPRLDLTTAKFEKAPALKTDEYAELYDAGWLKTNAKFYSAEVPKSAPKKGDLVCMHHVTDKTIIGSDRREVGQLDAVIVEAPAGKARFAIIGRGGVAGVGESYVAVPYNELSFKKQDGEYAIHIDATESQVEGATKVTPGEYPELRLTSVTDRIEESWKR
ncbi:MAG: hypothetical protein Aurels2KO_50540 [Aureliella sp.]